MFNKGKDFKSYADERGSSADWNDRSEFATPKVNRNLLKHTPNKVAQTSPKNSRSNVGTLKGNEISAYPQYMDQINSSQEIRVMDAFFGKSEN